MNEIKTIKVLFLVLTALTIISILLLLLHMRYIDKTKVFISTPMTKQQIILECERMSSKATNEGWSYKKCVENLQKAAGNNKTLEVI